jgi:sodium pump decarboxylase gamma subunit
MDQPITTALYLTVVGMSLLFVALIFLYLLMLLMTAVIKERPAKEEKGAPASVPVPGEDSVWRAAAIAVALARTEMSQQPVSPMEREDHPSPWRQYHHQRRLNENTPTRRSL